MICNTYVQFFKTISDLSRVKILFTLKQKDMFVNGLAEELDSEQSSISHNLRKLKKRGFVLSKKEGKRRKYSLTPEAKKMIELMDQHINEYFHKDCKCGK